MQFSNFQSTENFSNFASPQHNRKLWLGKDKAIVFGWYPTGFNDGWAARQLKFGARDSSTIRMFNLTNLSADFLHFLYPDYDTKAINVLCFTQMLSLTRSLLLFFSLFFFRQRKLFNIVISVNAFDETSFWKQIRFSAGAMRMSTTYCVGAITWHLSVNIWVYFFASHAVISFALFSEKAFVGVLLTFALRRESV
jgi:hypothetical protein